MRYQFTRSPVHEGRGSNELPDTAVLEGNATRRAATDTTLSGAAATGSEWTPSNRPGESGFRFRIAVMRALGATAVAAGLNACQTTNPVGEVQSGVQSATQVANVTGIARTQDVDGLMGTWRGRTREKTEVEVMIEGRDSPLPGERHYRVAVCTTFQSKRATLFERAPVPRTSATPESLEFTWRRISHAMSVRSKRAAVLRKEGLRRSGGSSVGETRMRRVNRPKCTHRLARGSGAAVPSAPTNEEHPLVGQWSGWWENGVVHELRISRFQRSRRGTAFGLLCYRTPDGTITFSDVGPGKSVITETLPGRETLHLKSGDGRFTWGSLKLNDDRTASFRLFSASRTSTLHMRPVAHPEGCLARIAPGHRS